MTTGRRKSERSTRRRLSSPGRPPVWQREHLCRFWRGIVAGLSSEEAGVEAGVSAPVGSRWFRSSGGMPPTHLARSAPLLKSRNLSFAEREEIAFECARNTGVRAIARKLGRVPSTISREIRRNSATRGGDFDCRALTAQWHADRAGYPLGFQRREEALHRGIVPDVARPAHRTGDAMVGHQALELLTCILGGFNWSSQHFRSYPV